MSIFRRGCFAPPRPLPQGGTCPHHGCRWGRISIPIHTPYPYPWGSAYPRQTCPHRLLPAVSDATVLSCSTPLNCGREFQRTPELPLPRRRSAASPATAPGNPSHRHGASVAGGGEAGDRRAWLDAAGLRDSVDRSATCVGEVSFLGLGS